LQQNLPTSDNPDVLPKSIWCRRLDRHTIYRRVGWRAMVKENLPMTSGYFEDIEVGDSRKAGPYFVSKDEIIQFARQYDPRPFHIDEEAAARSVFAGLSASAAHTFAIYIFLTDKLQPPIHALAGLGYDELRLPNPVRPGDDLELESITLEKRESKSKPDRGILRNQVHLRNQKRETVLQCIGSVLVPRRPAATAST
jgi:acyl dehydratase